MYEEMIVREYLMFVQSMDALRRKLEVLPKGSLVEHTVKNRKYLYLHYYEAKQKRIRRIHDEDAESLREELAKRKALEKQLALYKKEQGYFIRALKIAGINVEDIQQEYRNVQKARAEQQKGYQEELVRARGKRYSEQYRIPTLLGELVASKSEMMIANALARKGLNYSYEKQVYIGDTVLTPDFTIRYANRTYYWEHCGRMDDEGYVKMWDHKRFLYGQKGILEGDTLITTYETRQKPLTEQQIERVLTMYFE